MPDYKQGKPKPKYGGLWDTNKTAFVDSVNSANSGLNMVKRLYGTDNPKPIQIKGEDGTSTHRMANDGKRSYATVVQKPGSKVLTDLGNGDKAYDYAENNKEFINFKHPEQADWYSGNNNGHGSYGGYKQGTGVLNSITPQGVPYNTKYKDGVKNMKTYKGKYKKAANGLQSVAVPQQGSTSNVMSSATSMAAAGAQFGPWGAVAGGALGLATGMYQKDEQDKANMLAVNKNKYLAANRAVDGVDDSVDQKTQVFKGGGNVVVNGKPKYRRADGKVVKRGLWSNTYLSKKEDGMSTMKEGTKMIEIEGKGTPEIHTDKNFNVKNLGTTPHTKGGNKVEASEGDVVFNTQNSLAKYNKIAAAIQSGDKATLTKEKNRLPADGGKKNAGGNNGVKPPRQVKPVMYEGNPLPFDAKNRNGQYDQYPAAVAGLANGSSTFLAPNEKSSRGLAYPYSTIENSKGTQYKHNLSTNFGNASTGNGSDLSSTPAATPFTGTVDMSKVDTDPLAGKGPTTPADTSSSKVGNNIAQFAGIANNLYQGLKTENPIAQQYFDPQLNKYVDRSESMRQQSVGAMNVQNNNARNVSGGSAGNMRANQNQAALSNLTRQDAVNEQEMSRRDAIETSNTGLKNSAGQYNLQRRDMYQEQIDGTRAAKTAYMDQAAQDVGRLGNARQEEKYLRDKDAKQYAVQLAGLNRIKTKDFATDENGNQVTTLGTTPANAPTSLFPTPSATPAFNPQTLFTGKQTPTQKAAAAAELTPKPVKAPKYTRRRI